MSMWTEYITVTYGEHAAVFDKSVTWRSYIGTILSIFYIYIFFVIEDFSSQSAAVNVICELARKNPKNYLSLAPTFFKLMTSSTNNWMLIKIIKLFGALTPLEPRWEKKQRRLHHLYKWPIGCNLFRHCRAFWHSGNKNKIKYKNISPRLIKVPLFKS